MLEQYGIDMMSDIFNSLCDICHRPEGRPAAASIYLHSELAGNLPSEAPTRRPSDPRRGWVDS